MIVMCRRPANREVSTAELWNLLRQGGFARSGWRLGAWKRDPALGFWIPRDAFNTFDRPVSLKRRGRLEWATVAQNDQVIPPVAERQLAKRMGAGTRGRCFLGQTGTPLAGMALRRPLAERL